MPRRDGTVSSMLDGITSLAELEAFSRWLRNPPIDVDVKPATDEDWRRIADMKIQFQIKESRK